MESNEEERIGMRKWTYHNWAKFQKVWILVLLLIPSVFSLNNEILQKGNDLESDSREKLNLNSLKPEIAAEFGNQSNLQYEMLIITPDIVGFLESAEKFAEWKTSRGIPALVISNYTLYPGVDVPEQIRNAIIANYEKYPIEWVLLIGNTSIIPVRYVHNNDTMILSQAEAVGDNENKPTDYYYAELTSDWNLDGDMYWGEDVVNVDLPSNTLSELDYDPEVYVGRFPVNNLAELYTLMNKTIEYEKATYAGEWMGKYLSLSGILNGPDSTDLDGENEGRVSQHIIDTYIDDQMNWTHYYSPDAYYVPSEDPRASELTRTKSLNAFDDGYSIITYAGHGAPTTFSASDALFTNDIVNFQDSNMCSLLYAEACTTNSYDDPSSNSIGREFITVANKGGIGYIGSMRFSWYYPEDPDYLKANRGCFTQFMDEMFENGHYQQGKALYESKRSYMEGSWVQCMFFEDGIWKYNSTDSGTIITEPFSYYEMERKQILSYMLLGDPSVDIYTANPQSILPLIPESLNLHEGSTYNLQIMDENNGVIPYARITISSTDGKYNSFDADENGMVSFFLPLGQRQMNYTIISHNTVPYYGAFNVTFENEALTASFSADKTILEIEELVNFTFTGTQGTLQANFQWNFGDGSTNVTDINPIHQFSVAGNYIISLTITDIDGEFDTFTLHILVQNTVPIASFSADKTIIEIGEFVTFTFTGNYGTFPAEFQWNFADGTSNVTDVNTVHQFSTVGNYSVILTVIDFDGQTSVKSMNIVVKEKSTISGFDLAVIGIGCAIYLSYVIKWKKKFRP